MDTPQNWFLLKHDDGTVFGPISFNQIKEWASQAQVSPLDKISNDEETWTKAPMFPELQMDWLVQVTPDQYYGPTTIGAVQEFLSLGEITADTIVINACDGSQHSVNDLASLKQRGEGGGPTETDTPVRTSIRVSLQQRIRDLETSLLEERRSLQEAEERYQKLASKFVELTGQRP